MSDYQDLLINAFRPLEISKERHSDFLYLWEEVAFSKGDFLVEAGKIERYFYVVLEGVQAVYILTPKGDKKVIGFSLTAVFLVFMTRF